ncbi:NDR1/HIN1-like protein 13 [Miscanthus floridulus]|uniref:NDR1/HIN1-like protein 13 n=1 Tax=Miscanthus floridulus TaxID=154761 RepID=UPI0034574A66
MADRVHPAPPPPPPLSSSPPHQPDSQRAATTAAAGAVTPPTDTTPLQQHPSFARPAAPPPGTYIVQVPKDQVLRIPPPDRARRYKKLSTRPARRRALRRACCCACAAVLLILALAAAFAGAVYLVYRPRAPAFTVASLSIHGLNATSLALSSSSSLAPRLDAVVRADNVRNAKVGIEYRGGGEVAVSYDSGSARLAAGPWPAFRQPPRNVTALAVSMTGNGVRLTEEQAARIAREQAAGAVPLQVEATVHVRLRFGGVLRTWTVDVRARCDVAVDRLDGDAVAVNRGCKVKVRPLWWWW